MIYTVSSGTLNPTHSLKGCSKFSGLSHKYMFLKLVQLFIIHKSHWNQPVNESYNAMTKKLMLRW